MIAEGQQVAQIGNLGVLASEKPKDKSRLKFLLLLVGMERQIQDEVDFELVQLIGILALMDTVALRRSRTLIENRLHLLSHRINNLVGQHRLKAAQFGLDSVEEALPAGLAASQLRQLEPKPVMASGAVATIEDDGARGVPLIDALIVYALAYASSIHGRIMRGLMAEEDFSKAIGDIRASLAGRRAARGRELTVRDSFVGKVAIESRADLNAAYSRAEEFYEEAHVGLLQLIWTLSPAHPKYDICDEFAGKSKEQAEREGMTIPAHRACICFWTTRFDEARLQKQFDL